ncbi:hypothetical protein OAF54_00025 [bacterium]|nr:hypothetical protein [bacterium]
MTITKATEVAGTGNYPSQRHRQRERKVIQTANKYVPNDSTDWTLLPGSPSAPATQDAALDTIAAAVAEGVAKEVTGTLTSAQILAMNATPQVAIAAPGAGKVIVVDEVELFLDYNSAAYAADATEDLVLRCTTTTSTVFATWDDADTIIEGTADTRRLHKPTYAATFDPLTADNESVEFAILNGEWATGDSPILYRIKYRELTLITA